MGPVLDVILVVLGAWLLLYRGCIRTRFRFWVELLAQISCGASILLIEPLFFWIAPVARAPLLLICGALVGTCHPAFSALIVSVTLGSFVGALVWQLWLSDNQHENDFVPYPHTILLVLFDAVFTLLFCATPLGPRLFERLLVPVLAATLLTTGVSGLYPDLGGLSANELYKSQKSEGRALVNLEAWLVVSIVGVLLGALLRRQKAEEPSGVGLLQSFLPGGNPDDEENTLIPRPADDGGRFQILVKAMFAPEGSDMSHLTDHEKKLVEVCRKDEFERDRVIWGGGLI